MNKEKFPEYRNKVYKYIQEEIVPKYDEIDACTMEILKYSDWDVEFIFYESKKARDDDSYESRFLLEKKIRNLLIGFCNDICANEYYLYIYIIIM